jgi:uncharacterized iron-regulated membrane protein
MDARFSKRLRSTSRWVHTWFGIIFGSIVAVTCLTGSIVVFRQEADRPFRSEGPVRNGILDAAALKIGQLQPDARVTRVRFPTRSNDPYVFQVLSADKRTRRIAVDAASGQVLGEMAPVGWMEWTIDLHRNLLSGRAGRNAIGVVGILSVILGVTALLLWLLRGVHWRDLVRIRKGAFNFELHRATGLWALCFLVVVSLTGIGLVYSKSLRDAWERATGQPASIRPPKLTALAAPGTMSLDRYVAAGRTAVADGEPTEVRIPESPGGPVVVRMHRAGDLSPTGSNRVYLDPATASTLSVDLAANWPIGVRLFQSLAPIHYGEFAGLPVKLVWSIFGVAPSILFVTGLLVWWRPKRKSQRKVSLETDEVEVPLTEVVGR